MKNISIARALKEKNRISGKIARLQAQVRKFNRIEEGKEQDFNSLDLLKQLQEEWAHLISIKSRIAAANAGIAEKLVRLTEAKAELSFWNSFSDYETGPAVEVSIDRVFRGNVPVDIEKKVFTSIPSKDVSLFQNRTQKEIEDLQDEIDAFNASTFI